MIICFVIGDCMDNDIDIDNDYVDIEIDNDWEEG